MTGLSIYFGVDIAKNFLQNIVLIYIITSNTKEKKKKRLFLYIPFNFFQR